MLLPEAGDCYFCTMFKKAFFLLSLFPAFIYLPAQTGPGGVGTSTNNVLWLKADAGTSSSTNNTPISSWNDQSGNALGVTQTVSAQQPSFATSIMNGFPAIQFDNSTSSGQNDKMIGIDSPLLDNTSGYTFFTATRPQNLDGAARAIVSKRTGVSVDQSFMFFYYTSNKLYIDLQTTDNRFASNLTYSNNVNFLSSLVYDGSVTTASRCALYSEESLDKYASETATIIPDNASPLLIGTTDASDGRPFGGYVAEIILYREALGAAQRIIVNNYLSAKYNIALSANDKYAGDNSGNGDYDRQVAGIGQESTGSNPSFSASVTGGLSMSVNSGLDNGDYILAGHALATNTTITSDVGGMTGTGNARWERIWYMDVTNASTTLNINLEFDMSDGGMGSFTLGVLSNYVLLYRAGQSGNWTEVASASSISGDRVIFTGLAASDGYITLGTRNFNTSPLPVELLDFTAVPENNTIELNWSTASEKNNAWFILEKSRDGETFSPFAQIKGAGNSFVSHSYSGTDFAPFPGVSYYRLRQQDYDEKTNYSDIVVVNMCEDEENFLIFPNPGNGDVKLKLQGSRAEKITANIRDLSGRGILSGKSLTKNDQGFFEMDLREQLTPGIYLISICVGEKEYSRKLIIK